VSLREIITRLCRRSFIKPARKKGTRYKRDSYIPDGRCDRMIDNANSTGVSTLSAFSALAPLDCTTALAISYEACSWVKAQEQAIPVLSLPARITSTVDLTNSCPILVRTPYSFLIPTIGTWRIVSLSKF
jgi:hypothetical protein